MNGNTTRRRQAAGWHLLTAVPLALLLVSCGEDATAPPEEEPGDPVGQYLLESVAGREIPAWIETESGPQFLAGGVLVLRANGEWLLELVYATGNSLQVRQVEGRWTAAGGDVQVPVSTHPDLIGPSMTVSRERLTYTPPLRGRHVYRRAEIP